MYQNSCNAKGMLREHLNKFTRKQLKEYFKLVSYYRVEHGFFMRFDAWCEMMRQLNKQVRQIDEMIPDWDECTSEAAMFFLQDELYFFEYLNEKVIADALCEYINDYVIMAENMAQTLDDCGFEAAYQYPMMVLEMQARLGASFNVLM